MIARPFKISYDCFIHIRDFGDRGAKASSRSSCFMQDQGNVSKKPNRFEIHHGPDKARFRNQVIAFHFIHINQRHAIDYNIGSIRCLIDILPVELDTFVARIERLNYSVLLYSTEVQ
jgi:hypothetical protein